ncbi:hypothetical protein K470DRAFT_110659 [Piedraia hortae CBS 480.64]|uniref:Uncharacterized protein n=1 Tax=Piedraia hortae CBS 480.64 TaxID=1314780 RepID=A0A6A7BVM7_9PEZI|nr:hypothetical protein K470DRAFT_110659 [Piedraia hortae CBS 480.64]
MADNWRLDNLEHVMSTLRTAAGTRALTMPSQQPSMHMPQVVAAAATGTPDPEYRCIKCWHKNKNRECSSNAPSWRQPISRAEKAKQLRRSNQCVVMLPWQYRAIPRAMRMFTSINVEAFLLDIRSSYHFIKHKTPFTSLERVNPLVRFSQAVTKSKAGEIGKATVGIGNTTFHVPKAAYSPNSPCNILSAERLWRKNKVWAHRLL